VEKWADYLISKEKWIPNTKTIESFIVHDDLGDKVSIGLERKREWIVKKLKSGKTFCCIYLGINGNWFQGGFLTLYETGGLKWSTNLPYILPKRKCFISYYYGDDKEYKKQFYNLTSDLFTHKSVEEGDIDSENSADYVKQLINQNYLDDVTVLIVLIGPKTKCRKHVDWEISGALNFKVGDSYSGLLGLKLPTHPDYGTGKYSHALQPQRLTDNLKSNYAIIRDFTEDRRKLQEYVELAFANRINKADKRDNSRLQMKNNTCK